MNIIYFIVWLFAFVWSFAKRNSFSSKREEHAMNLARKEVKQKNLPKGSGNWEYLENEIRTLKSAYKKASDYWHWWQGTMHVLISIALSYYKWQFGFIFLFGFWFLFDIFYNLNRERKWNYVSEENFLEKRFKGKENKYQIIKLILFILSICLLLIDLLP